MIIALTGFMGCGKSSVGRELQTLLGCPLTDLDSYIEEKTGRSIPEIFSEEGEASFRQHEHDCLKRFLEETPEDETVILSLGGGTLTTDGCRDLIKSRTKCVYLRASLDTLEENLRDGVEGRPLLKGSGSLRSKISGMMKKRGPVYETAADIIVDTDGNSFAETAETIKKIMDGDDTVK